MSESTERPKISHVIPLRSITDRHQKPRSINDLPSNIDRSAPELRATISNNHRQPVARGTQMSSSRHSQQSSRSLSAGSYRAPKGALRLLSPRRLLDIVDRQNAPSAKRCIKTTNDFAFATKFASSQKAPSAKRCIKTRKTCCTRSWTAPQSESTERKRFIKTDRTRDLSVL